MQLIAHYFTQCINSKDDYALLQEVDIGLGPFSVNAARYEKLDFTEPIITDYLRILARKGSPEVDPWGFLFPLSPVVWVTFLSSLFFLMVAVHLLAFFVRSEVTHQIVRLDNTFLIYLKVFLQQGKSINICKI